MRQGYRIEDRFEILQHAGSGGMGTVYRALDVQSGNSVAVKLLTLDEEASAERFAREIAVLSQVSHPGIVGYVSHGFFEGRHYLVMEWIKGHTLNRVLDKEGLTVEESLTMGVSVANALQELHQRGLVHRDIKPSNLIFPKRSVERVKVLDFGLARRAAELTGPTRVGLMVGSPGYMSPEQARGQKEVSPEADVFSLGCVLYECLTGNPAFEGSDPLSIRSKVLMVEPKVANEVNAEVPPQLASLVQRMMSKAISDRPRDGAAVARAAAAIHPPKVSAKRRRRRAQPEIETAAVMSSGGALPRNLSRAQFVIVVGTEERTELPEPVRAEIRALNASIELLESGQILVVLDVGDKPAEDVVRAAQAALRLRRHYANVPMALVADCSAAPDLAGLIERGAQAIHLESMESLFAGVLSGDLHVAGIRLDRSTASLLESKFRVEKRATASYLLGELASAPLL